MSVFIGFDEVGGMRGFARELGMRYVDEPDRQYWIDNPGGLPELSLFKYGDQSGVQEMVYGAFAGLECKVFTYQLLTYPDDPTHMVRTCFLFGLRGNFPSLAVGPHSRLSLAQERSKEPFAQRFRVVGRDPEVASIVLDAPMQRWLLAIDPELRIEIGGTWLLGHLPKASEEQLPVLLQQLFGVYLRIPDEAWTRYGWGEPDGIGYQTSDPLAQR